MGEETRFKPFCYPHGSRMCVAGQRRAALEAVELILPGANNVKQNILNRAATTAHKFNAGADCNKHDLISFVVVDSITNPTKPISRHMDPHTGDYILETYNGRQFPANVFDDLEKRKKIY